MIDKVRFNALPLPMAYREMTHSQYTDFVEQVSNANQSFMRLNLPGEEKWAVVTGGRIVKAGFGYKIPNEIEIRAFGTRTETPYLLTRKISQRDIEIFGQVLSLPQIRKLLGENCTVSPYGPTEEEIIRIPTQSGNLNKLEDQFVLAGLAIQQSLFRGRHGKRHVIGATVARAFNKPEVFGDRMLFIASQWEDHVHARKGMTEDDRAPGRFYRLERHHRIDEPVTDIFDTYDLAREGQIWPDLILYRAKD